MVRPLPEAAALLACEISDFDSAERLLASLVRLPIHPVAVELSAGRPHEGNPLFGPLQAATSVGCPLVSRVRPSWWNGCSAGFASIGPRSA